MNLQDFCHKVGPVDKNLKPLLEKLHKELAANPRNLEKLKASLISLLEFLASPQGRTDENCRATDYFLMLDEEWDSEGLPEAYADILADMSGALHDTVSAPHIAENFDSTPEQLLRRALAL